MREVAGVFVGAISLKENRVEKVKDTSNEMTIQSFFFGSKFTVARMRQEIGLAILYFLLCLSNSNILSFSTGGRPSSSHSAPCHGHRFLAQDDETDK